MPPAMSPRPPTSGPLARPARPCAPYRHALAVGCALFCASLASSAWAQAAARSGGISPSLSASLGYSQSSGLIGSAEGGEFVTRLSPGLAWSSRTGRLRGNVNYALDAVNYSKREDGNVIDHRLGATVQAELIENRAFVDVEANAGQASISANGQQYAFDPLLGDGNRTQIFNLRVSPTVLGRLGPWAEWQVRLGAGLTDARDVDSADSNNRFALLQLASPRGRSPLGWVLQAQRQDVRFRDGRDTVNDRVNAQLNWRPDVDWLIFVSGGKERTNVGRLISRTYDNYGAGLAWTPSPRTRAALQGDRRYFGSSWNASFEYRTPRTIWRYSDAQDSTNGGDPNGFNLPITLFDLFFLQFASSFPDPIQREQAVRDFLRLIGRDPNELLNIGALVDGVSLQRRQELSVGWNGLRSTVTLQAFASTVRTLDSPSNPANPDGSQVRPGAGSRQIGMTVNVSHRLTPRSTLNASATYQTSPDAGGQARNRLGGISLGYTSRLSRTANLTLQASHSDFTSDTVPYRDTSLSASVNLRF